MQIIASPRPSFANAIWDRQPTHQARRDLLSLALETVRLTKRQKIVLEYVIDRTKTIADRRNELIHAEYVVYGRTNVLHAKVKSPRSTKPAKHQKVSPKDLTILERELEELLQITEGAWLEFQTRKGKQIQASLRRVAEAIRRQQQNQQSDSVLQFPRQTPDAE